MNLADQHDHVQRMVTEAEAEGTMRTHLLEAAHAMYDAERRYTVAKLTSERLKRENDKLKKGRGSAALSSQP